MCTLLAKLLTFLASVSYTHLVSPVLPPGLRFLFQLEDQMLGVVAGDMLLTLTQSIEIGRAHV